MKKVTMIFFVILSSIVMLVACQSNETKTNVSDNAKEERLNKKVEVDKELKFNQFNVEVKAVKFYEKDGALLADIKLDWRNKAQDYVADKMSFFVATMFEVNQGDEELTEINDAWNPENKLSSDVFFQNALGGKTGVKMTYELINRNTPIDIIFTPTTETEGSETITVDID